MTAPTFENTLKPFVLMVVDVFDVHRATAKLNITIFEKHLVRV